ncbi:MAG TPA: TMEM175 family protein [Gemmatimonadaceae bacterium]|nr:TMEM175 family protein [Gemmatimonadaceae bacterium]
MSKNRLEAFSDAVIAIVLTIMVLELKISGSADLAALRSVLPAFLSYVLSFVFLGIYWSNHHHMLHATETVTGGVLWANLHLLFWLSLVPAATAWMGGTHFASLTLAVYGVVLLCCAIAYTILQNTIIRAQGADSVLAEAVGSDTKGKISLVCYVAAIALAYVWRPASGALYVLVALIWLVPDRRIESRIVDAPAE